MSRAALRRLAVVAAFAGAVLAAGAAGAAGLDPHVDPSVVRGGCMSCHEGHGAPRSPMLPAPQKQVCDRCHSTEAALSQERGQLASDARPPLLSSVLSLPFTHPISDTAFSRSDGLTCTSCHSPHRASPEHGAAVVPGRRKLSPRDPNELEYELCQSCHGDQGVRAQGLSDVSRLFDPINASYHPVEAPATGHSPSLAPGLASQEINCTDCHGSSEPGGARGPHGSRFPYLLRDEYRSIDGEESPQSYALCYRCHRRELVLATEGTPFPEHRRHVVEVGAACGTCHSAHGSERFRALINFGEASRLGGPVSPAASGAFGYESTGPGSGTCWMTCHGYSHDPEYYGFTIDEPPKGPPPDGGGGGDGGGPGGGGPGGGGG